MKIIAEIGVNWDDIDQAKTMIELSRDSGCSYAKFQLYDKSVIQDSLLQSELMDRMLSKEDAQELVDHGKSIRQPVFFSTMFLEAVDWVAEIGVPMIKVRYSDRYNLKLVEKALDVGVPVLISADHRYLNYCQDPRVKLLYCISRYPADPSDYVLTPIDFSACLFAGVSIHTDSGDFDVMDRALQCGADFCEVHVKIDNSHPIEDAWSKSFSDLKEWIANNHAEKKM